MPNIIKYVDINSGTGAAGAAAGEGENCGDCLVELIPGLPELDSIQNTDLFLALRDETLYKVPGSLLAGGGGGGDVTTTFTTIEFDNGGAISDVVGYAQVVKNSSNEGFCHFSIALLASNFGTFDMSAVVPNPYPQIMPNTYEPGNTPYTYPSQSYDGYVAEEVHAYLNIQTSGIWQIVEPFNATLEGKWLFFNGSYPIATLL
jgi:hypothetical protein